MNFKVYDILSSLVPGFLIFIFILFSFHFPFDKDMLVPYTAIAFLLGYLVNAVGSWLEDFYCFTWGGKPSDRLLKHKGIWKVKFYHVDEVKTFLKAETSNPHPSNDELFGIAMMYANNTKDNRSEDFNALYAFSRSLLTSVLISTILLLITNYSDWRYYATLLPILFVVWLRCKQRSYYYAKEVLTIYLKIKKTP